MDFSFAALFNALVYAFVGVLLFLAAFVFIDRLTPYDLWTEIVQNKNAALAILLGALSLGISIIIAAAVH
jgi:putative membrane protein